MRFLIAVLMTMLSAVCLGQSRGGAEGTGTMKNDQWDFISTNRMLMWVSNNGRLSHNPLTSGPGLIWPAGTGKSLAYAEGLVYGGTPFGEVRVGGATYIAGWQAGSILADGGAEDPSAPGVRIYRAHRFDAGWWDTLAQYKRTVILTDLINWPVASGAPWTDANHNGVYDPDTTVWLNGGGGDSPNIPGDEALWCVSNDLDSRRVRDLYGSTPIGVQIQTMIWASAGHPLLDNAVFREYTLIIKGIGIAENFTVGAWEDVDMGEPFDDLCGVDTALGLAYAYNGRGDDDTYGLPPATGTLWLQTPVVPKPGATARFGTGSRTDYENLPLSAFVHYIGGSSTYRDPQLGNPDGALQMMNNLEGRMHDGGTFLDPVSGQTTPLLLAGDPVLGKGWIDGIVNPPGDRRFLSASGPATLEPGDTQKVVLARIAAEGGNRLLSVRALRKAARQVKDIYRNMPLGSEAPVFSSALAYGVSPGYYEVRTTGGPFPAGTTSAAAILRNSSGREIQRGMMFDDGQHDDGAANDGVYGAILHGSDQSSGADLFVVTEDAGGEKEWFVESEIALPGPVTVRFTDIVLDSPKLDGRAQPGEYVRLRLRIDNGTATDMGPLHLFFRGEPSLNVDRVVARYPGTVPAGGSFEPEYDPNTSETWIGVDIPADAAPGSYVIPVTLISEQHCLWEQDLTIEIDSLPSATANGLLAHVEGLASGSLGYTLLNPEALTDHDYRVSIEGEDAGAKTMFVEDVTLGTTLYRGIPVPNSFAPYSPQIDGWAVTIGTAIDELVYDAQGQRLESFTHDYTAAFSEPSREWFRLYNSEISMAGESYLPSLSTQYDLLPVRLVFDRMNGQKAPLYVRGANPNYSCVGVFDIPVRAYDMSDTANPRQIMLAFGEQVNMPSNDSAYMPTDNVNSREFLLVFADDYHEQPDAKFLVPLNTRNPTLELLYLVWALRDSTLPMFEDGDAYTIMPRVPVSRRDVYILARPRLLDVRSEAAQPEAIALHPNYPNPFGPGSAGSSSGTNIRFDTPHAGHAQLAVYDMLGRRIMMLVDQELPAGTHTVRLDAAGLRGGSYVVALDGYGSRQTIRICVLR